MLNLKEKQMKGRFYARTGKRISLATLALALWSGGTAWAQQSAIEWEGEALPEEGGQFYLFNKGGNGFLVGANDWGTHMSVGERGLLCTLIPDGEGYRIQTFPANNWYLCADGWIDNGGWVVFTVADTNPDDGENVYTFATNNNFMSMGNGTNLAFAGTDASVSGAQWLLVSAEQYMQKNVATLEAASKENPVDATFYINGADFNRNQPHGWQVEATGGTWTIGGGNGQNPNKSAEAFNNDRVDIYQTLTGLENGIYEVYCQGFYRPGGGGTTSGPQNAFLYAKWSEVALPLMPESWINDMDGAGNTFAEGKCKTDTLRVIVTDGTLRMGIRKETHIDQDWVIFDNFRLTYYGEVEDADIFEEQLQAVEELLPVYTSLGATAIAAELQATYDQYKETTGDYTEAIAALSEAFANATTLQSGVESLVEAIAATEAFSEQIAAGTYVLPSSSKTALNQAIATAKATLTETTMATMAEAAASTVESLNALVEEDERWIAMTYPLVKARDLADQIGGLSEDEAYTAVAADLENAEVAYETVAADVAALNLVCREAMTAEFLSQATAENPIDLTSFITNPNIYQTGADWEAPDGWVCNRGQADGGNVTNGTGNAELNCYSWSGWAVKSANYYQILGENGVGLPDGTYRLAAAAITSVGGIFLYASPDGIQSGVQVNASGDENAYQAARTSLGTTTWLDVTVSGGKLYVGMRGNNSSGGSSGQNWRADNFRLYYIGAPQVESQTIQVSDAGMATFYSANAFTVPEGLTAGVVIGTAEGTEESAVTVDWRYAAGSTVPALTGVLLSGEEGPYTAEYGVGNVVRPADNLLAGTLEETTIDAEGYLYYKLANDPSKNGLGFYWAAPDGHSITNKANKAYLALPEVAETSGVRFFSFNLNTVGVGSTLQADDAPVDVYTLSGIRVRSQVKASEAMDGLQKGIYIVNGKKYVVQ